MDMFQHGAASLIVSFICEAKHIISHRMYPATVSQLANAIVQLIGIVIDTIITSVAYSATTNELLL